MEQQNNSPDNNSALPEVQQELSKVAASPKQSILILIGICIVFGYLFFIFFINNKGSDKDVKSQAPTDVTKPAETAVSEIPTIPQLPEPPKLVEPTSPPPPPLEAPLPSEVLPSPSLPVENIVSPQTNSCLIVMKPAREKKLRENQQLF